MSSLQHSPLTKSTVKESILDFIYGPVNKRLKTQINGLILTNTIVGGYSHKSFVYKGELYSSENTQPPRPSNNLLDKFKEAMDEYLQEKQEIENKEHPYVSGYINHVLNSSNMFGDYLRVFPDCLHPPVLELMRACPCHNQDLEEEQVERLKQANQKFVDLIKQRLLINMIS